MLNTLFFISNGCLKTKREKKRSSRHHHTTVAPLLLFFDATPDNQASHQTSGITSATTKRRDLQIERSIEQNVYFFVGSTTIESTTTIPRCHGSCCCGTALQRDITRDQPITNRNNATTRQRINTPNTPNAPNAPNEPTHDKNKRGEERSLTCALIWTMPGRIKANVLPEPVAAMPIMSRPDRAIGHPCI